MLSSSPRYAYTDWANMSGNHNTLQSKIKDVKPRATFIHCAAIY